MNPHLEDESNGSGVRQFTTKGTLLRIE